jgi:hypothetical protein
MNQPTLFDNIGAEQPVETDQLVLYALGEFQARGKVLSERELPLDRLRGAFRRAAENFGAAELADEKIAQELERLGARIVRVPSFVAKHPFRVTIGENLAARALEFYERTVSQTAETKI